MDERVLIVGQGLAGTSMAMRLLQAGKPFKVVDATEYGSASMVSSGLINPITGRRYVKSWLIEELLPEAQRFYEEFERLLEVDLVQSTKIVRALNSAKEDNDWSARIINDEYHAYVDQAAGPYGNEAISSTNTQAHIINALRLNMAALITNFREFLAANNYLIEAALAYDQLLPKNGQWHYDGDIFSKVVFCDGWRVTQNPWFNYLAFDPAKGECLIIKAPDLKLGFPYKDGVFIMPMGSDIYWVGASYAWQTQDEYPTDEKRIWLKSSLDKIITCSYEIVDQWAGIRPATKYRKPLIGQHPNCAGLYLFNGLGTKGVSIAPYFSKQLFEYMFNEGSLHPDVDIAKFDDLAPKS